MAGPDGVVESYAGDRQACQRVADTAPAIPRRQRVLSRDMLQSRVLMARASQPSSRKVSCPRFPARPATSGPVRVYRGDVPSGAWPITVVELTTLQFALERSANLTGTQTTEARGSWSLTGVGARLSHDDGDLYHSMRVRNNTTATLQLNLSSAVVPPQQVTPLPNNGGTRSSSCRNQIVTSVNVTGAVPWARSGSGGSQSISFTITRYNQSLAVDVVVESYCDIEERNAQGVITFSAGDVRMSDRYLLVLYVMSE
jgi:hypothetical protein